jgi:hypothetical protein
MCSNTKNTFKSASEIQEVGSIVSRIVPFVPVYVERAPYMEAHTHDYTRLMVSLPRHFCLQLFSRLLFT